MRHSPTGPPLTTAAHRAVEVCTGIAGVSALAIALSWTVGVWQYAAFGQDYTPMAPVTAWLLVLLNASLFSLS
ncbi:MAG: hypothetical protein Q7V01_02330, partial [Vicinamibacterales bacterium]|nr:hypothetical protein [Vicinamibacterales bacterium]